MIFKYNNSETMLYNYIDQLFDEYIKVEQIDEVELFLSKVRYKEEKELLKTKIKNFPEYIPRFWLAAYLSKISRDAGCILRASVTQCPFIMYLLHLASYNILKKGGLEKPYLYKQTEISIWNMRVGNEWYDSVKHRIDDFFTDTGYQYLWVGAEKTREPCGIVSFPEKVELLEYSHWYCDRLPDGTICFQEEIIPEFLREVQGYYTEISRLPFTKGRWKAEQSKKELWHEFIDMQCLDIAEELVVRHFKPESDAEMINALAIAQFAETIDHPGVYDQLEMMDRLSVVTEEDLWNYLKNNGLSEKQAYYWSDLISRGQLRNYFPSFCQSGIIFDEYFVDILCSISFLPSKWCVMERFYEMKDLLKY